MNANQHSWEKYSRELKHKGFWDAISLWKLKFLIARTVLSYVYCCLYTNSLCGPNNFWICEAANYISSETNIPLSIQVNGSHWTKFFFYHIISKYFFFPLPWQVFLGCTTRFQTLRRPLPKKITSRYIRLYPQTWDHTPHISVEFYGCNGKIRIYLQTRTKNCFIFNCCKQITLTQTILVAV